MLYHFIYCLVLYISDKSMYGDDIFKSVLKIACQLLGMKIQRIELQLLKI